MKIKDKSPQICGNINPIFKEVSFSYCFYKSAFWLKTRLDKELSALQIIAPQGGILLLLNHLGSISQNELCSSMGIDKATMVKLIDGLEKLNCVQREDSMSDRRVKIIALTAKGRVLLKKAGEIRRKVETEFLSTLSSSEKKTLQILIPKLLDDSEL